MGVQDSDGAGEQCGRSNEGLERHHGKRGNAQEVVQLWQNGNIILNFRPTGGGAQGIMRSPPERVRGSTMKSALPSIMRTWATRYV